MWLATREGGWGWLADSFTHYFRMALVHLGLPGWQASFANLPLIPWAEVSERILWVGFRHPKNVNTTGRVWTS